MTKINNSLILNKIKQSQMCFTLPKFKVGDFVTVSEKIVEGKKTRIQKFTGLVIKFKGTKNTKTFIVRKESYGVNVEKTFLFHSPQIAKIELIKKGKVRRAYLSYVRKQSSKAIKI